MQFTPESSPAEGSTPESPSPAGSPPEDEFLDQLRRRRAELRESLIALELALAAPAPLHAQWTQRVNAAAEELSADFQEHVAITEGPDGLYSELARTAPRLSGSVAALSSEHASIARLLADLLARVDTSGTEPDAEDVERVRALGTALLGRLVRHRQRGSDLVYQAYAVDIGGET